MALHLLRIEINFHDAATTDCGRSMICPNPSCNSDKVTAKRKFHSTSEERMGQYKGINLTMRKYKCHACSSFFETVEITRDDFVAINGFKLAKQL